MMYRLLWKAVPLAWTEDRRPDRVVCVELSSHFTDDEAIRAAAARACALLPVGNALEVQDGLGRRVFCGDGTAARRMRR